MAPTSQTHIVCSNCLVDPPAVSPSSWSLINLRLIVLISHSQPFLQQRRSQAESFCHFQTRSLWFDRDSDMKSVVRLTEVVCLFISDAPDSSALSLQIETRDTSEFLSQSQTDMWGLSSNHGTPRDSD